MGTKMLPLLAAVDGVVHRVTFNNTSTGGNSVTIKGADGWTYHYLHVNNDTPGHRRRPRPPGPRPSPPTSSSARRSTQGPGRRATWATPATPRAPARTSTSRSGSPPPPGSYTGRADQPVRVAPAGDPAASSGSGVVSSAPPPPPGRSTQHVHLRHPGRRPRPALRLGRRRRRRGRASTAAAPGTCAPASPTRRHRAAASPSAPPSDTPLCGDLDGDGTDEPVLVPRRHLDRARPASRAADPVGWTVTYGVRPATSRCSATGTATATTTSAIHRGRHLVPPQHRRGPPAPPSPRFTLRPAAGDQPVAGDWDGDGDDDAGHLPRRQWHLRSTAGADGASTADRSPSAPPATSRSSATAPTRRQPGHRHLPPEAG